jgi:hypothetical protein
MAAQQEPRADEDVSAIGVVFDPNGAPVSTLHKKVADALRDGAPAWRTEVVAPGRWTARRANHEIIEIQAVHWRATTPIIRGLPDEQNLERLLHDVLAQAFTNEMALIERWLGEMAATGRSPSWKGVIHLWCALTDDKASEITVSERFLGQNKTCAPVAARVLQQTGLLADLAPLLS